MNTLTSWCLGLCCAIAFSGPAWAKAPKGRPTAPSPAASASAPPQPAALLMPASAGAAAQAPAPASAGSAPSGTRPRLAELIPGTCDKPPEVPKENLRDGIEGRVVLLFRLDGQGVPEDIRVARSAGKTPAHQRLDDTAVQHLRRCRYQLSSLPDLPQGLYFSQQYDFRIE